MGDLPHGQPHNTSHVCFGLFWGWMKTRPAKTVLTFGGLIASFYNTYGERNAKGILRLVVKANLVTFRAPNRYVVSRATRKA